MYLRPVDYANLWNVSYSLVMKCIRTGRLKAYKISTRQYRIAENEKIQPEPLAKKAVDFITSLNEITRED